jgi:hypothetical protein
MERFKRLIQFCVAIAGFLNAGAIAMQGFELMKIEDSTGHTVGMYFVFLFIQAALVANAAIHKDKWQASGMIASMVTTVWVISLILIYR